MSDWQARLLDAVSFNSAQRQINERTNERLLRLETNTTAIQAHLTRQDQEVAERFRQQDDKLDVRFTRLETAIQGMQATTTAQEERKREHLASIDANLRMLWRVGGTLVIPLMAALMSGVVGASSVSHALKANVYAVVLAVVVLYAVVLVIAGLRYALAHWGRTS